MLIYEPRDGARVSQHTGWFLRIGATTTGVKYLWGLTSAVRASHILIDLRSIVRRASVDQSVEKLSSGRLRFTARTESAGRLEAIINPHSNKYESLTLWTHEAVLLEMEEPVVATPVPTAVFEFPQLPNSLDTIQLTEIEDETTYEEFAQAILRSIILRAGVRTPAMREEIEQKLGEKYDWEALAQRDARNADHLRSLLTR